MIEFIISAALAVIWLCATTWIWRRKGWKSGLVALFGIPLTIFAILVTLTGAAILTIPLALAACLTGAVFGRKAGLAVFFAPVAFYFIILFFGPIFTREPIPF